MSKSIRFSDIIKSYEDYNTSGEFFVWIEKLELVAKLQGVTDLTQFLPLFLAGPAFAVYQQLSDEVKADYNELKGELRTAFSIDVFSSYEQLKSRTLSESESADVYLADIKRLVNLMGQTNSEPLIRCAFVSGLPSDVAMQLKSTVDVNKMELPALVSKARAMLASRGAAASFVCAGIKQGGGIQCYNCSGSGHLARECPSGRKDKFVGFRSNQRGRKCYVCDSSGHLANKCPERSGNANGGASASDARPAPQP